ncbi:MAG: CAP domain-containing protein [Clostridia bacterium]
MKKKLKKIYLKMYNKNKILFVFIIFSLILSSTIFAYSDKNYKPKYGVAKKNVNIRKTANLEQSSIVKNIKKGTPFKIVGTINDFYIVQLQDNQIGLISKDFVILEGNCLKNSKTYESLVKYFATVNDNNINLRSGPSTNFATYSKLNTLDKFEVIGKIDNFFLIVTAKNEIGMVKENLIKRYFPPLKTSINSVTPKISDDATIVLDLINKVRKENGLAILLVDSLLNSTAQNKALDMVENDYFSHTSPTYGSPFEMMRKVGISYKTAGENIAGNSSLENAVTSWLNSESHRKNVLSNAYNYIGIGVEKSNVYGYIIVAMFIGK